MPTRTNLTLPGGRQIPIVPEQLSDGFLQQHAPLIQDQAAQQPDPQDFLTATQRAADQSQVAARERFEDRVEKETQRALRRQEALPPRARRSPERVERLVTSRLARQEERDRISARRVVGEDRAEVGPEARYNEFLALNEERMRAGLDPRPIPDDLLDFARTREEQRGVVGEDGIRRDVNGDQFVRPGGGEVDPVTGLMQREQLERLGLPEQVRRGRDLQAAGTFQEAEAVSGGLDEQARLLDRTADRFETMQQEQQVVREERLRQIEEMNNQFNEVVDQISSFEFDPTGGFSDAPALNKALSFVAISLGGLASGVIGGPNVAMEVLNNQIKRDIDAQIARFNQLGAKADMSQSLYGRMLNLLGQEDLAAEATEAALKQSMAFKIEAIGARSQSEAVQAGAMQQAGALVRDAADQLDRIGQSVLARPEINVSEKTQQRVTQLRAAEGVLDDLERDFSQLRAETGLLGRIPGTAARQFNRSVDRRLLRVIRTLIPDEGRAERMVRSLLASEGMNARTFETTFRNAIQEWRRALRNEMDATLTTAGDVGEDVEVFGPRAQEFEFIED